MYITSALNCLSVETQYFENDYGIINQVILPLLFGALGCWVRLIVSTINLENFSKQNPKHVNLKKNHRHEILKSYSWIFIISGALAGFAAVNLINPQGTFAQITTLSFIAGLSGITFLLRSSLVEGVVEDKILNGIKNETLEDHYSAKEEVKNDNELTIEELASLINETYNIDTTLIEDYESEIDFGDLEPPETPGEVDLNPENMDNGNSDSTKPKE
ncbi:hypothetical protein [Bacillus sp. FJAT-27245]|uniref:hypothetical protein n=1 Tax=Bacillus sp. FJAT-27245 TaxID=1684144 RepID=UPI0006A7E8EE|nr:hypothetical protein [Bacillus sp. FJAT-27245]